MRTRLLLFIFLVLCSCVKAQTSPRAQRYFDKAMRFEAQKKYAEARAAMEKAIQEYPAFGDAYSTLGAWYFKDHHFDTSAAIFRKAYMNVVNGKKLFAYPLAKSLVYSGRAGEALAVISQGSDSKEWKTLREQALFVQQNGNSIWKDTVFNMGPAVNTNDAEMFPWISTDEQRIYFTRRRNNTDEDFYVAQMDTCGEWYTAKNMGRPPNTPNQEAAQMISADGHYLFFMQCENRSENGWAKGGCDLYMSYTADSVWSAPQSFGATINSPGYEGMPCLSPDNRELYFISDREGGMGGMDIWVSRFEDGLWRQPKNLGAPVNTPGNETAPFLDIDNHTLYFSSDGHVGFGGADLFISRRVNDSLWSKPLNMGAPVNSAADETSLCVNIPGNRIYFASDRDSVAGNFDLYQMTLPEKLRPVPVNIVKGYVYDSLSQLRLNYASIYVRDFTTQEDLYHFNSNRGDGSFMITLPAGKKYLWHTDRVSYQDGKDTLDLTDQVAGVPYYYNIPLLPSDYIAPVHDSLVLTIWFPVNGAELSDSDKIAISTALEPWLYDHSGLVVFVNGYTDNTGTPLINEQLSYMRAGLVTDAIEALGIDRMNIQTKGWGEADPLDLNDSEEGRSWNRRVEVIIRR